MHIPEGFNVLLDVSPAPLGAIMLKGNLTFDPEAEDLHLDAMWILLNGGDLTIGTEEDPFPGKATVTLRGDAFETQELPVYGSKSIAVRLGDLSIVGQKKLPAWTRLAATARAGDDTIVVEGVPGFNWQAGDQLVLASSSVLPWEYDEAEVASVEGPSAEGLVTVRLAAPLAYTHLGVVVDAETGAEVTPAPRGYLGYTEGVVDMRAEVGNLTRNVVVEGDEDSERQQFGAVITVHSHGHVGQAREHASDPMGYQEEHGSDGQPEAQHEGMHKSRVVIKHAEVRRAGQAFRLGRYPIHFHMHGDSDSVVSAWMAVGALRGAFGVCGDALSRLSLLSRARVPFSLFFISRNMLSSSPWALSSVRFLLRPWARTIPWPLTAPLTSAWIAVSRLPPTALPCLPDRRLRATPSTTRSTARSRCTALTA